MSIANVNPLTMQLSDTDIKTILQVRQRIECGIFQHIPIKDLCKMAGMGRSKLIDAFFLLNKTTIHQYRLNILMEFAGTMLDDDRPVKEVAILLGYKTSGHFSRAFKNVFGITPSEYKVRR